MQLTWLGAAGFKLDTREGATLLIDPYLSRPEKANPVLPIRLADLAPVDEILLTHGGFDHALDTPALAEQTGAIVHAPGPVSRRLAELGVSAHCLQSITLRKIKAVGALTWQALPGQAERTEADPFVRVLMRGSLAIPQLRALFEAWPSGELVSYFFRAEGLSMIHFGSAGWVASEIQDLRPDIALLPVESKPDTSQKTAQLVALLKPKVVIPHHWDNYYPPLSDLLDLTRFEAALQALPHKVRLYKPTIGESFNLAELVTGTWDVGRSA